MNLLSLQHFCSIAQYGSMTRAAETLHISQPALSKMLHQMESELGQPLFYRVPTGLQLTEAGKRFYQKVSAGLELIQAGIADLQAGGEYPKTLRVFSCINAAFLAQLYLAFQKRYPQIQLELMRGAWNAIPQNGSFDFAFMPSTLPTNSYQFTSLFEEEFVLAVPRDHPLAQEGSIDLSQAAPYPFITMGAASPSAQYLKALCGVAQFTPRIAVECDTMSTLYAFLESGQGITLVPACSACINTDKLRTVRIHTPRCSRTIRLCWPSGRDFTPLQKLFHTFCVNYFVPPLTHHPTADDPA